MNTEPLTRSGVAQALAVSIATVRRYEASGELNPSRGPRGVRLFDASEVESLRARRGRSGVSVAPAPRVQPQPPQPTRDIGEDAAEVFALLDEGFDPATVVRELRVDPRLVVDLVESWIDLRAMATDQHAPAIADRVHHLELVTRDLRAGLTNMRRALEALWPLRGLVSLACVCGGSPTGLRVHCAGCGRESAPSSSARPP